MTVDPRAQSVVANNCRRFRQHQARDLAIRGNIPEGSKPMCENSGDRFFAMMHSILRCVCVLLSPLYIEWHLVDSSLQNRHP